MPKARLRRVLMAAAVAGGSLVGVQVAVAETAPGCSGTVLSPGANIQAALDSKPAGSTFCFDDGTYRLTSPLKPKTGTVLWGAPGTVLNGSRQISSFERSGDNWVAKGQTQEFIPSTSYGCAKSGYTGCNLPEGVFVNDKPLWQVTSLSELGSGEFYFDKAADKVYVGDDPSGKKVEVTVSPAAVVGFSRYQTNVTVRGFVIEKFASTKTDSMYGAVRVGDNWLVEDNEIRHNASAGVLAANGLKLKRNHLHHNGQYGFQGIASGILIEDNEVSYNNTVGFTVNYAAGGSKIYKGSDVTFRDNYVHDNAGPGLWCDTDCIRILYEGNRLERNVGPGIHHEISADAVIRNNTFRKNGTYAIGKTMWYSADLFLHTSKNTEIYGNTIEAGINGIGLVDYDRGSGAFGVRELRNVYVHDNDVEMPAGGFTGLLTKRSRILSAGNRFQSNTYTVPTADGKYWKWNDSKTAKGWKAVGQDTNGTFLVG